MFGSYVNGTPQEDNDLDVAVVVDELVGDFRLKHRKISPHIFEGII
jgi:predicted nucleotidyltransferase